MKSFVFKILAKINLWYDRREEPRRFLYGLGIAFLPWTLIDIYLLIKGRDLIGAWFPTLWIMLLLALRFPYVNGNLKKYL